MDIKDMSVAYSEIKEWNKRASDDELINRLNNLPGEDEELSVEDVECEAEPPVLGIDTEADSEYYEVFVPSITPRQAVYDFCNSESFEEVSKNVALYVMGETGPFALTHLLGTVNPNKLELGFENQGTECILEETRRIAWAAQDIALFNLIRSWYTYGLIDEVLGLCEAEEHEISRSVDMCKEYCNDPIKFLEKNLQYFSFKAAKFVITPDGEIAYIWEDDTEENIRYYNECKDASGAIETNGFVFFGSYFEG